MTYKTHVVAGVAVAVVTATLFDDVATQAAYVACAGVGALLPDLDHSKSYIRRYIPFPHMAHRGFTHSIVGALLFSLILIPFGINGCTIGLIIGYMSHILTDMLTIQGVCLMWPQKKRYRVASIKTGTVQENGLRWLIVIGLIYYIYERMK